MSSNLAVLRGRCSSPPEIRVLASGSSVATLQITTRTGEEPAVSVPVSWWDPPAWVERLGAGDEVLVVGRVRRRFYRAGGATASRVDVEVESGARRADRRRAAAVIRRAGAAVDDLCAQVSDAS